MLYKTKLYALAGAVSAVLLWAMTTTATPNTAVHTIRPADDQWLSYKYSADGRVYADAYRYANAWRCSAALSSRRMKAGVMLFPISVGECVH